jgi:hypothetical protein
MTETEGKRPGGGCNAARAERDEYLRDATSTAASCLRIVDNPEMRARVEAWALATIDIRDVCRYVGSYLPTDPALVFDLGSGAPEVRADADKAAEDASGHFEILNLRRNVDLGDPDPRHSMVHRGWVGNPAAVSDDGRTWHCGGRRLDVLDVAVFHFGLRNRHEALARLLETFGRPSGRSVCGVTPSGEVYTQCASWDCDEPTDWPCATTSHTLPIASDARKGGRMVPVNARHWVDVQLPPADPIMGGCWDTSCKCVIVGGSKEKKSFMTLQLTVSIAVGCGDFLGWEIPRARRVLLVQPEIPEVHFQRRLQGMLRGLGHGASALGDRLQILNCRGTRFTEEAWHNIEGAAVDTGAEVVVFDPFYKLFVDGDENLACDVRPILQRLDDICESTGAGVLTVLHTPKGTAGDRKTIDRSAGSGIVARDFDAGVYLGEHAQGAGALVVESVVRCYPARDPFTIRFDGDAGIFRLADDLAPVIRTSRTRTARGPSDDSCRLHLLGLVARGPIPVREFDGGALARLGVGEKRLRDLRAAALEDGALAVSRAEPRPHGRKFIGTPAAVAALEADWRNPALDGIKS